MIVTFFSNVQGTRYDTLYLFVLYVTNCIFMCFREYLFSEIKSWKYPKLNWLKKKPNNKQPISVTLATKVNYCLWSLFVVRKQYYFSDRTGPITVVSIHIWGARQTLLFAHSLRFALLCLLCSDSDINILT